MWDGKKSFRLGKGLEEAYRTWLQRVEEDKESVQTVGDLLDRYLLEEVPKKSPTNRSFNFLCIKRLKKALAEVDISSITPADVYQYIQIRSKKKKDPKTGMITGGQTIAMRETEVLSHAYTKAVEWGLIRIHPFLHQVRITGLPTRDRYVTDDEMAKALSIESKQRKGSVNAIHAYILIKSMTGMSRGDLLALREGINLKEDGIHIQRRKTRGTTGKRTIYSWTEELIAAVNLARQAKPAKSEFLFCTRTGASYIDEATGTMSGWKSMWQRFMKRVVSETGIEPFHDLDVRAKAASDAASLEHARALLTHADVRTTQKHYRRKAERVQPLLTGHLKSTQ